MPSLSSSNSVFGRFKRHNQDSNALAPLPPPSLQINPTVPAPPTVISDAGSPSTTASAISESERNRLQGHKRESSINSLSNSVNGLRRSVSLRSHKSQPSSSSYSHKPRLSSSLSPSPDGGPTSPFPPQRSGTNLSISPHFRKQSKSTENIHTLSPPIFESNPSVPVPPLTAVEPSHRNPFSMLTGSTPSFKRHGTDRPSLGNQSSFSREMPGAPLQHAPTLPPPSAGGQNPHALYTQIIETANKRIATIEYLKRVHSGDVYYFSTLHYTPGSLSGLPSMNSHKLGRRSTSYLLLGYSMPALLDLNSNTPLEYLKALFALLQEFETYQNLSSHDNTGSSLSRGRMGQMFKSGIGLGKGAGKGRRASATTDGIMLDTQNANLGVPGSTIPGNSDVPAQMNPITHEFQHLLTPHLPFDPDFGVTFATLCDTLVETYQSLLTLITGPDACTLAVGDAFSKADKSVRKLLVANVVREFEDSTRAGVKGEVAGLGRLVLGGLM